MKCIIEGWPNSKDNIPNEAKSYWSFREELSIINGKVKKFKGEILVILEVMRKKVLAKWRARTTIFWPQINQQINNMVEVQHLSTKSDETAT